MLAVLVAGSLLATGLVVGHAVGDNGFLDELAISSEGTDVETASPLTTALERQSLAVPEPLVGEDEDEPIAAVAAIVAPSVVSVEILQGEVPIAQGSGIVWDSGLIVTNAHVVQGATEVLIRFANGLEADGDIVGSDPARDIAVISIDESIPVTPATFAPVSTVKVGQTAVAVGSPFSLEQTVTSGIVSAVGRTVPNEEDVIVEMIQTDASINPGNSGGALADRQGRVIAMNTSIRTDGTSQGNVGVGFAIPTDTILLIAERLLNGESLETGYLGIHGESAMTGEGGVVIGELVPGAPAERAGLMTGDLITALDGRDVGSMGSLAAEVQLRTPGEVLRFTVMRGNESVEISVRIGAAG
ncbi:MAG: trypsin-like peptidase domain-containing protein [Acidobacteria bacterium]|nr:trypsin-like peptidase domain-containing protein [Acidobacteriota bacterium]